MWFNSAKELQLRSTVNGTYSIYFNEGVTFVFRFLCFYCFFRIYIIVDEQTVVVILGLGQPQKRD